MEIGIEPNKNLQNIHQEQCTHYFPFLTNSSLNPQKNANYWMYYYLTLFVRNISLE